MRDFSLTRLRETVLRDLVWLLNTTNLRGTVARGRSRGRRLGAQLWCA